MNNFSKFLKDVFQYLQVNDAYIPSLKCNMLMPLTYFNCKVISGFKMGLHRVLMVNFKLLLAIQQLNIMMSGSSRYKESRIPDCQVTAYPVSMKVLYI